MRSIRIVPAHATGELVIRGDCTEFLCATQANGGCVLWAGKISTEGSAACQLTLYDGNAVVESARVTGTEACVANGKRVTLGDGE